MARQAVLVNPHLAAALAPEEALMVCSRAALPGLARLKARVPCSRGPQGEGHTHPDNLLELQEAFKGSPQGQWQMVLVHLPSPLVHLVAPLPLQVRHSSSSSSLQLLLRGRSLSAHSSSPGSVNSRSIPHSSNSSQGSMGSPQLGNIPRNRGCQLAGPQPCNRDQAKWEGGLSCSSRLGLQLHVGPLAINPA